MRPGRKVWIQLARGMVTANDHSLFAGDGLGVLDINEIKIKATDDAELLLFDLAA
jgi:quercetin 2,3-dioxygenase